MKYSESLHQFLQARKTQANADLIDRWSLDLETQMNVLPGDGEQVAGKRTCWSNGTDEWFSVRVPKGANAEPSFTDFEIKFPLDIRCDAVGSTGWNWKTRQSKYVGYDYDTLLSHAEGIGISDEELARVREKASQLAYIETRRSSGGGGIHLYSYLDNIATANHTEHAALARAVLGKMSADCNYDFASHVDACGQVLWFYSRKATAENHGFEILHPATQTLSESDLPGWRDHISVVNHQRTKVRINAITDETQDTFEALASARKIIPLDASHKEQIEELQRSGFTTLWIADHHLLQTHTKALEALMESDKRLVGVFKTNSAGRNPGQPNCFLFPMPKGAWRVFRFSPGISEADTWTQDKQGWTTCAFNKRPSLQDACIVSGGLKDPDGGGFVFADADKAMKAAELLGQAIKIEATGRQVTLKTSKDGELVAQIVKEKGDTTPEGWIEKKGKFVKGFKPIEDDTEEEDSSAYDNMVRSLKTCAKQFAGWYIHEDGSWTGHPVGNVKMVLQHLGLAKSDAEVTMGGAVAKTWELVSVPFADEYPGGRKWNMDAARFKFLPAELDDEVPDHPTWDRLYAHAGQELTPVLKDLPWAAEAGIKTGADYFRAWIACAFRYPYEPLPLLFLFGPQNSGKSSCWEALQELVTKGVVKADRALTNQSDFNGELAGAVIAVIEEKDISKSPGAAAKLKDVVTSRMLSIRRMRTDSYELPNCSHWIQTANRIENCPVFPGDTRITVMYVPDLPPGSEIPKEILLQRLKAEAPHFMYTLMNLPLPPVTGRLRLPVVTTASKRRSEEASRSELERYINDNCRIDTEARILVRDFVSHFVAALQPEDRAGWARKRVVEEFPVQFSVVESGASSYFQGLTFKD